MQNIFGGTLLNITFDLKYFLLHGNLESTIMELFEAESYLGSQEEGSLCCNFLYKSLGNSDVGIVIYCDHDYLIRKDFSPLAAEKNEGHKNVIVGDHVSDIVF